MGNEKLSGNFPNCLKIGPVFQREIHLGHGVGMMVEDGVVRMEGAMSDIQVG
jgi:hypothetical protein